MSERKRFIDALNIVPIKGRVPHFELVFYLTMEAFNRVHPQHRRYDQWHQMSTNEKRLILEDIADIYVKIAKKYEHSAIFVQSVPGGIDELNVVLAMIKERGDYFTMIHGDATHGIPDGEHMLDFACRIADEAEKVHVEALEMVNRALGFAEQMKKAGCLDGFALCTDYCFNTNPFLSPTMFSEFVTPYLKRLIAGYRDMGYYTIKHTDGQIMPILDQLAECNPHALHSIDPQASVDIAEVKRLVGNKICLIGNVNCGLLQSGTEDEVVESVRYALNSGMPGGGYIFSTSNCIYTGMSLARYELMLDVWRDIGNY